MDPSKMDISNIMCLLALLLCCTYLSLIQNQIGAAVLFKILAFQAKVLPLYIPISNMPGKKA